jgi:hypothetical protein
MSPPSNNVGLSFTFSESATKRGARPAAPRSPVSRKPILPLHGSMVTTTVSSAHRCTWRAWVPAIRTIAVSLRESHGETQDTNLPRQPRPHQVTRIPGDSAVVARTRGGWHACASRSPFERGVRSRDLVRPVRTWSNTLSRDRSRPARTTVSSPCAGITPSIVSAIPSARGAGSHTTFDLMLSTMSDARRPPSLERS